MSGAPLRSSPVELSPSGVLKDQFGRRFSYLRLSVTDACNFRCVYCLPNGYKKDPRVAGPLSLTEIENLVAGFAELGTVKVRLTGGEPTLRADFADIVRTVRAASGIETLAISTNGFSLEKRAEEFRKAGVDALNVSLDTLDEDRFERATGTRRLKNVLAGIDRALEVGFPMVKVNAVLMAGINDDGLSSFLDWVRERPIAVRFIELMPTGTNSDFFKQRHLRASFIREKLMAGGWEARERGRVDGPALEYTHPDYRGRMGFIAPYAKDFCSTCNRLRVTSQGGLRLCLFGEGDIALRDCLARADQREQLRDRVLSALATKDISHHLPEGRYGNNKTFSAMGG